MVPTGRMGYGMLPRDLAYARPVTVPPYPARPARPAGRRAGRHRHVAALVTATVLVLLVVLGWTTRGVLADVRRDFDRRADTTVCRFAEENRC